MSEENTSSLAPKRGSNAHGWWPEKKRIEVVTTYLALGKIPLVEAVTGVPRNTIRHWKLTDWWKEIEDAIRSDEDTEMDTKLTKIVNKSLDAVLDRVEHGYFMWDSKTQKIVRRPLYAKDTLKITTDLLTRRDLLREKPIRKTEQVAVEDRLAKLAAEFIKFVAAKDVTPPQEVVIEG